MVVDVDTTTIVAAVSALGVLLSGLGAVLALRKARRSDKAATEASSSAEVARVQLESWRGLVSDLRTEIDGLRERLEDQEIYIDRLQTELIALRRDWHKLPRERESDR